ESDGSGINPGNGVDLTDSVVSTIYREIITEEKVSKYSIGIKKVTGFFLHTNDDPKQIILDVEEQTVENGDGEEFAFSKEEQSFTGNASGNVITVSGISYSRQGSIFSLVLKLGTIGTGTIPQAEAEIID